MEKGENKMRKFITSAEYAKSFGTTCPVCNSRSLRSSSPCEVGIHPHEGLMTLAIFCADCKSTWTEEYRLCGYTELREKKVVENE